VNGCGSVLSFPYFISYVLTIMTVFVNLFVAVMVEGFQEQTEIDNIKIKDTDIDEFRTVWKQFDPEGSEYVLCNQLEEILVRLAKQKSKLIPEPGSDSI